MVSLRRGPIVVRWMFALAGGWAALAIARDAQAFCRTVSCPLPADFSPSEEGTCLPADFAEQCAALDPPVTTIVPLWWRNACTSYDIQQDASVQVPYATADKIAAEAFSRWTGTMCAEGSSFARVSIDVRDLGPVSCDLVQYNTNQGNQHVIVFRDSGYAGNASNTLGLTTITYDADTGEILDADMEINSGPDVQLATSDPIPSGAYDLQSIITHEAGHFLGMAHSTSVSATMYAFYVAGTSTKRILSADDMAGICSIYPPNGSRAVAPSVAASGFVNDDACDPTPANGFQSQCATPVHTSCGAAGGKDPPASPGTPMPLVFALASALAAAGAYRRARGGRDGVGPARRT
jgi:hypothetical protein